MGSLAADDGHWSGLERQADGRDFWSGQQTASPAVGRLTKYCWYFGICSSCGEAMETGEDLEGARKPCVECLARPCEVCELDAHRCCMKEVVETDEDMSENLEA